MDTKLDFIQNQKVYKEAGLKPTCPQCQSKTVKQIIIASLLLHSSGGKEEEHTHLPRIGMLWLKTLTGGLRQYQDYGNFMERSKTL